LSKCLEKSLGRGDLRSSPEIRETQLQVMASMIPRQVPHRAQSELDADAAVPARHLALLQLGLYFIVGGICFCIDIGGFVALRLLTLPILTASVFSFVTATLVNYLLCCGFVFRGGRFSRPEEIVRLFIIALVGLGLNTAAVLLLAKILRLDPTLAKILAVFPVFAWNYLGRRAMVFDGSLPAAMTHLAERVRGRL
jgi:putative flippase GtrA